MKKRILTLTMAISLALCSSLTTYASEQIKVDRNKINIVVNGNKISSDNFLYEGTTYVPLRTISEGLNNNVSYNDATKTAAISQTSSNDLKNTSLYLYTSQLYGLLGLVYNGDVACSLIEATEPNFFSSKSDDECLEILETFDTVVKNSSELYNTVHEYGYVEMYEMSEQLKSIAVSLNEYGNKLTDARFKNYTGINSDWISLKTEMNNTLSDLRINSKLYADKLLQNAYSVYNN